MPETLVFLLFVILILLPFALSLYGTYLATKENVLLGLLSLFVNPLPLVIGIAALFGKRDLSHKIAKWLRM